MSNNKQYNGPDELYRAYQEKRDDIPAAVLAELMARAEALGHEDSIHAIVQAAKVHGNAPEQQPSVSKPSWLTLVVSKLSAISTPQLGTTFACLAMVAVIAPMLLSNNTANYPEVAHLSDCPQCGSYISNATASTRSSLPGINKIDPETRLAAKLGIISARLKIESLTNSDLARDNALASLQKQTASQLGSGLSSLIMAANKPDVRALNDAIENSIQNPFIGNASEALFIANISARNFNHTGEEAQLRSVLGKAMDALGKVPNPSILQQKTIVDLKAEASKENYDISLVNAIEAASKALGG